MCLSAVFATVSPADDTSLPMPEIVLHPASRSALATSARLKALRMVISLIVTVGKWTTAHNRSGVGSKDDVAAGMNLGPEASPGGEGWTLPGLCHG